MAIGGDRQTDASLPSSVSNTNEKANAVKVSKVEFEKIRAIHVFGPQAIPNQKPATKVTVISDEEINAAKTKLELKLEGVMYSEQQSLALAVISFKKVTDDYSVGTTLPVPGQVELVRVLEDRVVISNNGRFEALWLYEEDQVNGGLVASAAVLPESKSAIARQAEAADTVASSYREKLYRNPESLKDAIQVSAARENGEMLGYRIRPGRNPRDFELLGFKANDIVTRINEVQLNDPRKALQLYQLMRYAKQAQLTIQRGDRLIELELAFDGGNS